ncbi:MAG: methyltransferase domain-containing protein [Pseudomonadota bacterium]
MKLATFLVAALFAAGAWADDSPYTFKKPSRDGIGKVFMGREISHVMGHRGASWLERDSRVEEERTDLLLQALPLEPGDTVADIGAGTGYFSFPMARRVPEGKVLAVDIQPEMLEIIQQRMPAAGVNNVEPVLATATSPNLPAGEVDVVLLVDAYHEFSHPAEVMAGIVNSLSERGRVILVEYRGEDFTVPIKPLHKMTIAQAELEMKAAGLVLEHVDDRLPRQHIMIYRRTPAD